MVQDNNLGITVTDKHYRNLGIVLRKTPGHPGEYLVRVWSADFNRYIYFSKHWTTIQKMRDDNWFNAEDPEFLKICKEDLVDLALATRDKKWFDKLIGKTKESEQV